ncbi:MAG: class I SAM-dependent methyltransferase family protein [Candidatus Aenigmatarchaeota archaeon]|nr:MAG: class I SAM-dependent methyltransferase family protein [Candidatus Aenigmarchaeota archaeon]
MKPEKFREIVRKKLEKKVPEENLALIPSGFQRIGKIAILNLPEELHKHKRMIGNAVLKNFSYVKTVCMRTGSITGELREPRVKIIAGEKTTVTTHRENKCVYKIDVARLMFSKGNLLERGRLPNIVRKGETVVDMFAGIGYFSIPIAKLAKPARVFAIDKNPVAMEYMKENIRLNKVGDRMVPVFGDCMVVRFGDIGDRIIMGFLPKTYEFLPAAFEALKPEGGVIHYHDTFAKEELWEKPIQILETSGFKHGYVLERVTYKNIVKEYAPNIFHVVLDAEFRKRR